MTITEPSPDAVSAYWQAFVDATGTKGTHEGTVSFGDSRAMAEELGRLVLVETKRATAGLLADYEAGDERLPAVGDHGVLHLGDGVPVGILRVSDVRVGPYASVDAGFAWDEGEGDRSLAFWKDAHEAFFRRRCADLGITFDPGLDVVFERFELVWAG